jgi:hypothetical protein
LGAERDFEPFLKKMPAIVECRKALSICNSEEYGPFKFKPARINKKHYELFYDRYVTNAFWVVENLNLNLNIDNKETTTSDLFFEIISKKLYKIYERLSSSKLSKNKDEYYKNISLILIMSTLSSANSGEQSSKIKGHRFLQNKIKKHLIKNIIGGGKKRGNYEIVKIKNRADGYLRAKMAQSMLYNKFGNQSNNLETSKIDVNMADIESLRDNFEVYRLEKKIEIEKNKLKKKKNEYSKYKIPERKKKLFEISTKKLFLYELFYKKKSVITKIKHLNALKLEIESAKKEIDVFKTGGEKYIEIHTEYANAVKKIKNSRRHMYRQNQVGDWAPYSHMYAGGKKTNVDDFLADLIDDLNISGIF